MQPLTLGRFHISRVAEFEGPTSPRFLFPYARPEHFTPFLDWLAPRFYDPAADRLLMSIHTYIVRTPHQTMLVDTCLGNDKRRSYHGWNMRQGPYLDDLRAAGVEPDAVDLVLCTHLHVDHVGWNTRLVDGRWVPTFPNARYVFSRRELAYWLSEQHPEQQQTLADSVRPVLEAGLALLVEGQAILDDGVVLEPTPGHTPGHCSVHLRSAGAEAVITGDLMHHPIQIALPDWCSAYCTHPDQARATRRTFLTRYAGSDVKILGTHFAEPCWGHVVRHGDGWAFGA